MTKKKIGLSRLIKLEWLNKTVELILEGKTEDEISKELEFYLSFEIKSKKSLYMTKNNIMNIWVRIPDEFQEIKDLALGIYDKDDANKLVIHWCMMLLAYPVFSDVCALIGKITDIQGIFTTRWLKQNLSDIWGERTTLLYSTEKILQTLKYMGVIENEKKGVYKTHTFDVDDEEIKGLIVLTVIAINSKAYYEITELSQIPQMFPFNYSITHELLYFSDLFLLNNFGGRVVVARE